MKKLFLMAFFFTVAAYSMQPPPYRPERPTPPPPPGPAELNIPDCLSFPQLHVPGAYIVSINRAKMAPDLVSFLMSRLSAMAYLSTTSYPHYVGDWVHITLFSSFVNKMPANILLSHIRQDLSFLETGSSLVIQCIAQPGSAR